jgi:hypothetical protein
MWLQEETHVLSRFPPAGPSREFPLCVQNMPKYRQRMFVYPDAPGGSTLDPTTPHHTSVHTMCSTHNFWGIPTLRASIFKETLIR